MASTDYLCKQGDVGATFTATLLTNTGAAVNLTGATVTFVARAQTAIATTVNAAATIVNAAAGQVSYTTVAADTANPGLYMVEWHYTLPGGVSGTWPYDGWQEWRVEDNLTTPGGARIVGLTEVREHLGLDVADRSHDARLLSLIDGLTPVVEGITGPVVQRLVSETYDGGNWFISLRRRPVIEVHSVTEYRGPVPYYLAQVPTPDLGSIYSYMFEPPGRIVRRTAGGGITTFPPGADQVFVSYTAGYATVPGNIREGMLELIRLNYQPTEQGGAFGGRGSSSDNDSGVPDKPALGYLVPGRVRELLASKRRHPSVA